MSEGERSDPQDGDESPGGEEGKAAPSEDRTDETSERVREIEEDPASNPEDPMMREIKGG